MDIPVPIVIAGMGRPWVNNMYDSTKERFLLLEMVTQHDTVRTDTVLLLAVLMSCHAMPVGWNTWTLPVLDARSDLLDTGELRLWVLVCGLATSW